MASNHRASLRSERHGPAPRATIAGGINTARPRAAAAKRSVSVNLRASVDAADVDNGRVRVAVRLRPKTVEDLSHDVDSTYCIELQPEMKRLTLRKNNWSSESYKFDEVLTENASQKRVYEVVARPVVESVLTGYNGTVMAYGQTGTGKTYTLGRLGREDPSERGIMVRAMEGILTNISPNDTVAVSYLQLYLESIQDLLDPEKNNISIVEDPKTGEVSLPGASIVAVQDLSQFLWLLQTGETNRHAANTKLNTESSRSHAILMVYVKRSNKEKSINDKISEIDVSAAQVMPLALKSKLLIVDLAGSERINKSGSEGRTLEEAKFINLSLTSLGKCINALAENCPHIPIRDSKLTRLLRDSFGGSARTSLIITIGQSAVHQAETASTIMFGQRAMKVVNTLKLREELDYESLCRKLEFEVDRLTMEFERQHKFKNDEKTLVEKKLKECESSLDEAKKSFYEKFECLKEENLSLQLENKSLTEKLNIQKSQCDLMRDEMTRLEISLDHSKLENANYQKKLADATQMYEKKIADYAKKAEEERSQCTNLKLQLARDKSDNEKLGQEQKMIEELKLNLQALSEMKERTSNENVYLKDERNKLEVEKAGLAEELSDTRQKLNQEGWQRKLLEDELGRYKKFFSDNGYNLEAKQSLFKENISKDTPEFGVPRNLSKSNKSRDTLSTQRTIISKILEEVGLRKVLALLKSGDLDVQIEVVKVVANLAAEDNNQERIVEEGGLDSLLVLLESSRDRTIIRLASAALANLAMNGANQSLIMSKGGGRLLANLAFKTEDLHTLRMVAGAIANLCGNEKLHDQMKKDGVTKALLEMSRSGLSEVIAQIVRGIANFAKCETRERTQGKRKGKSLLIDDGIFLWIISHSCKTSGSASRHIELALCHLAQNEQNASDMISSGGIKELIRVSEQSSEEYIRNLAKKILKSNPSFMSFMQLS